MSNLFTDPPRDVLIAPSILAADFAILGDECRGVLDAGADLLHVDVMDGHFVPNLSMGPALTGSVRTAVPDAMLDVHLMVTDPAGFVEPFADAGADHLSFHIEVFDEPNAAARLAGRVHALGLTAGIAINPGTDPAGLMMVLDAFDLVLIMGVMPGFAGQSFKPECLDTAETVLTRLGQNQRLQIDGGVGIDNAAMLRQRGFDVLVGGSSIYGVPPEQRAERVRQLRESEVMPNRTH